MTSASSTPLPDERLDVADEALRVARDNERAAVRAAWPLEDSIEKALESARIYERVAKANEKSARDALAIDRDAVEIPRKAVEDRQVAEAETARLLREIEELRRPPGPTG